MKNQIFLLIFVTACTSSPQKFEDGTRMPSQANLAEVPANVAHKQTQGEKTSFVCEEQAKSIVGMRVVLDRQKISPKFKLNNKSKHGLKIKVAFFDADSTLRVSISGSVTPTSPEDVMILPDMGNKLKKLAHKGYLIYIVSNQSGVSKGHSTCVLADQALVQTIDLVEQDGGIIHGFDFAESYDGYFRKPAVGMATRLEGILKEQFGSDVTIDKEKSFMVGDSAYKKNVDLRPKNPKKPRVPGAHPSNVDRLFAENYGIKFIEAAVFFGWRKRGIDVFENVGQVREYVEKYP